MLPPQPTDMMIPPRLVCCGSLVSAPSWDRGAKEGDLWLRGMGPDSLKIVPGYSLIWDTSSWDRGLGFFLYAYCDFFLRALMK